MSKKDDVVTENDAPKHMFKTAKRLFGQLKNQKIRLVIVIISVIITTVLNIYAPYYSAGVMDSLASAVKSATSTGSKFTIIWEPLGRQLMTISILYAFIIAAI